MSKKVDGNQPNVTGIFVTLLALVIIIAIGVFIALVLYNNLPTGGISLWLMK